MKDWSIEFRSLLTLTQELLETINSDSEWSAEDEKKLKQLTKIASLLDKVKKVVGIPESDEVSAEEDERIIENFLARALQKQERK